MLACPAPATETGSVELGLSRLRLALAAATATQGVASPRRSPDATGVGTPRPRGPVKPLRPPDPALRELVDRACTGDVDAFGALYDKYVGLVYRYVYYRVANAALSEDLTSETFLRALRAVGTYRYQGKDFGAWLVTIARNLIADHFKSGRYRLELPAAELADTPAELPAPGPEGLVLEALSNQELLGAVKRLAPDQQECIAMRFLAGMSVTETASVMGKNEGAVKALQYRAIRSLARLLPREQW